MRLTIQTWTLALGSLVALGCAAPAAPPVIALHDDLGSYTWPIDAGDSTVQAYYNQGMRLTWAFNHPDAILSFEEALRRDSSCVMCAWGIAFALGPNLNAPMDSAVETRAVEAISHAASVIDASTPPVERMLVEALAQRYGTPAGADRATRDSAWARALDPVIQSFPDDDNARLLSVDAAMNLRPWDYWNPDRSPAPGTAVFLARLDSLVNGANDHPGVCHLYIHAVEAVAPERAVWCAERLAAMMPGAGHLVHMPAHIYVRVGRYQEAVEANRHATHADAEWLGDRRPEGIYAAAYVPHNFHFLAHAATFAGMSGEAISAARAVASAITPETAREVPWTEPMVPYAHLVMQTFGKWDDILALPPVSDDLPLASALAMYARGMALSATDRAAEAEEMVTAIRDRLPAIPEGVFRETARVGLLVLTGDIHERAGRLTEAIAAYREAVSLEDGLQYNEPPFWHQPVRHFLGAALLEADRPAEAEAVYLADLERNPENGWALTGLTESYRMQGKPTEEVAFRARAAWAGADVPLMRSRF